jgi:deazaflavin-dependent oxidoreductase (nitroreductase family)
MSTESAAPTGASIGASTGDVKGRIKFSSRGRTQFIVLRPPYAQPIDRFLVRWTGWSPVTTQYALAGGADLRAFKTQVLLLTTIGRKSGALRSTVLPYFDDGDDLVICGTNGGGPHDPQWVKNIDVNATCWVTVNRRQVPATAHIARGEERERIFAAIAPRHGGLRRYQEQTSALGRDVPLVVITPREPR